MTSSNPGDPTDPLQPPPVPQFPDGQQVPPYGSKQYYEQQPYGPQSVASGFPPPYGGYPQPPSTNGLAIAALVLSFICAPIAIVCGIIGLDQIKTSGQGGRRIALAGIALSALWILLTVLVIITVNR